MSLDTLENIFKKADSLTPSERLLLASRLIDSVRQQGLSGDEQKQRKAIQKSLKKLSTMKVFTDITDPVEWQKQIRKDRTLPGRSA